MSALDDKCIEILLVTGANIYTFFQFILYVSFTEHVYDNYVLWRKQNWREKNVFLWK